MAHTMLNVSTHIMRLCLLIPTLVSITPTIGSGTGFCVEDSDGTSRYSLSRNLTVNCACLVGGKMEHLLDKKQWSLGR
jgi:hypothetical protein